MIKLFLILVGLISFCCQSAFSSIIIQNLKWKNGQTLKVLMMNGTEEHHQLFRRAVSIWAPYINLKIEFHVLESSKKKLPEDFLRNTIRVQFNQTEKSYSKLGTNFNLGPRDNVSYLNIEHSPDDKIKFVGTAVHEFGHALGLLHEHQHPDALHEDDVIGVCKYKFFLDVSKERELKICMKNLAKISSEEILDRNMDLSSFDKYSVMLYSDFLEDSKGFFNVSLSLGDKLFIAKHYPFDRPLTVEQIEVMHQQDREEEMAWIFTEYQAPNCKLINEYDDIYMVQSRSVKEVRVLIREQREIDNYFQFCAK